MATSQSQKLAVQKYRAKTYDTIGFDVPKGKREEFKTVAAGMGLSLAKFLLLAAESYGANHAGEEFKTTTPAPMTTEERKLIEDFNALPDDVRKSISKLIRQINQNQPQNQAL